MILRTGRNSAPTPPFDIAEEVEKYARESGRHGKLVWVPGVNAWEVRFSLKSDDPVRKIMQATGEEQYEKVLFMEPNPDAGKVINHVRQGPYRSMDIHQMGPSGVREFLERGNTWSGRGEFGSHAEAARKAKENNAALKARVRRQQRNIAVDRGEDARRQVHSIPFLRVGVNLNGDN